MIVFSQVSLSAVVFKSSLRITHFTVLTYLLTYFLLVLGICNLLPVCNMSQTGQPGFIHLLFLTSVGILERLDFTSMLIWLGGCLYAHAGELQNKCFTEFILL